MSLYLQYLDSRNLRRIGGPGCTVEVDESCFVRKQKYRRGVPVTSSDGRWVFGMIERRDGRQVNPSPLALTRIFVVDTRTAANLEPLIRR